MALDVLAIGELNPDLILSGFSVDGPVIGTEQAFADETLTLGSSTAIACVLMQRLGLRTGMATLLGDDPHGAFCRDILIADGVDVAGLRFSETERTGITIALSYPADRMLLTRYGTMQSFTVAQVDPVLLASARHLHVGSFFIQSGLRPGLPEMFRAARARGQSTSLDLGWDPSGQWDIAALRAVLPHVSVIFPNRSELEAVTGASEIGPGLQLLHEMGADRVALKLGGEGAVYAGPEGEALHPGYPVAVRDTTGAGDAFNAGFLREWLEGKAAADCLALGNACGALTAGALGGTGGLRSLSQARELMRRA